MNNPKEDRRIDSEINALRDGSDPFAAAMRATRMPMLITDPRQPDNPIVFVNDAFHLLTGYTREETLGRNCRFLQGPGSNTEDVDRIRRAIDNREAIEIELLNYRKDGRVFWNRLLMSPVFDGGELTYFVASQFDVTRDKSGKLEPGGDDELNRRISDLSATEERLQFTLKAGGLGTWTLDVPRQRLIASGLCKENFGRQPTDNFTFQDLQNCIHPDDLDRWREILATALAGNADFNIQCRIRTPIGTQRWIEIRAQTRFDEEGRPIAMSGISVDITERKNAEAHRLLMNQEMSHRIKNILATVQAIVSQSLRSELPHAELREVVSRRLEALGGAHDVLTGKDLDVAGLRQTIQQAVKPFNSDHRIKLSGPDVEVSHAVSSALTMALHELATNAVKYGSLSNDEGHVLVQWQIDGEFVLVWTETGGPAVQTPTRTGFGSRMIERALAATLRGTAAVDYKPDGVRFELRTTPDALNTVRGGTNVE